MNKPNLTLNGVPGTLWEIRRQESIHPYLGWRQSILIINSLEKALKNADLAYKKSALALTKQRAKILNCEPEDLEIISCEIAIAEYEQESIAQLVFDTKMELKVAEEEKQRIEYLNLDMVKETYMGLQEKYASCAFQCKLARSVVISALSSSNQISESAAEVLYDSACLSQNDREHLDANILSQLKHWGLLRQSQQQTNHQFLGTIN
jgi:hypothetical protein